MGVCYFETPISEGKIRKLKINDEVYLTGSFFGFVYPWQYQQVLDMLEEYHPLPFDLTEGVISHISACYSQGEGKYQLKFIGSTTSGKFNKFVPQLIEKCRIRAVIGKGEMNDETLEYMKRFGAVYLAFAGGCSAYYSIQNIRVKAEYLEYPGSSDHVVQFKVFNFGPLLVTMDSHGQSIYREVRKKVQNNIQKICSFLEI